MEAERMAFEAAIREDWNNDELRLVYSDWLEGKGDLVEAERQRNWPAIRAASRKWLEEFAIHLRPYDVGESIYSLGTGRRGSPADACDMMLRDLAEDGYVFAHGRDCHNRSEFLSDFDGAEDFFKHVEIVTGKRYDEENLDYSCSC